MTLLYIFLLWVHPLHVSVTEINYSGKDKALQITSRIFIDDLELAIQKERNQPDMDILEPGKEFTTAKLISDYVNRHFRVKIDNKIQRLHLLGHEVEDAAVICYLEIENVKNVKAIEVFNDMITAVHDDQSNLVHITYKSPVKSARLMAEKPAEVFKFGN